MWGEKIVKDSRRRWDSYSKEKQTAILTEAGEIYRALMTHMGDDPGSPQVQTGVAAWHQNLRNFYEPTVEVLRGLGHAYSQDPRFRATFTKMHPDLPEFLTAAIEHYCASLGETA
jgi:hypothetical protein